MAEESGRVSMRWVLWIDHGLERTTAGRRERSGREGGGKPSAVYIDGILNFL